MGNRLPFEGRPDYEIALLRLLCKLPTGKGKAAEVCRLFETEHRDQIPAKDYEILKEARQPRWEKHVNWCRGSLKQRGFLDMPTRGIWRITDEGRRWVAENQDAEHLPPLKSKNSGLSTRTPQSLRASRGTHPTIPGGISLDMLEKTRQSMPTDQFRQVWGAIYDRLIAEERAKAITDITQTELGRRAQQQLNEVHAFLTGKSASAPSSEKLCDWIYFCYTLRLYREAAALLSYVRDDEVEPIVYKKARRLAEVSRTKLGAEP